MEKKISKSKIIVLMVAICVAILTLSIGIFGLISLNTNENKKHSEGLIEESIDITVDGKKYLREYNTFYGSDSRYDFYEYDNGVQGIIVLSIQYYRTEIENEEQLKLFSHQFTAVYDNIFKNNSTHTIWLFNDLDMKNYTNLKSIGSADKPFKGKFYGNGHTIKNLQLGDCSTKYLLGNQYDAYYGLFACIDGATITNLYLDYDDGVDSLITPKAFGDDHYKFYMGLIAGYSTGNSVISDCYVNANKIVYNDKNHANYYVNLGGIVGKIGGNTKIINCGVNATFQMTKNFTSWGYRCGGIAGSIIANEKVNGENGKPTIENSYYYGNIISLWTKTLSSDAEICIGGIIGLSLNAPEKEYVAIKGCYAEITEIYCDHLYFSEYDGEPYSHIAGGRGYLISTIGNFYDTSSDPTKKYKIEETKCNYGKGFKYYYYSLGKTEDWYDVDWSSEYKYITFPMTTMKEIWYKKEIKNIKTSKVNEVLNLGLGGVVMLDNSNGTIPSFKP